MNNSVFSNPRLFVDDTCLILQDKSLCQLQKKKKNNHLNQIFKWMMTNKLTLNLCKSNIILIQPKNLNSKVKFSTIPFNFVLDIFMVNSSKCLGILLEYSLTFEPHIKILINKLSKPVGI